MVINFFQRMRFELLLVLALTHFTGCVTPQQKKEMEDEISRLQVRVIQLESSLSSNRENDQKVGEQRQKTIISTSTEVEKLNVEIKRMKGEIDALKVGVQTGQMPGQEAPQEGSIASQLEDIRTRLEAVESSQKDLSVAIEKINEKPQPAGKRSDKKEYLNHNADSSTIQTAYDRKRFKEVIEDAPGALKKAKGKEREQILMMYGESLMRVNRPKEAALQFNELVEMKPNDKLMAQAKLRLGDAFKALGEQDTAKLFYEEVVAKYPDSPEAGRAKKALKSKK